jgi:hypothetical protein
LVIDGFSVVVEGALLEPSEGGAEPLPMTLRLSVLEMPLRPAEGRDSGEPTAEEACEVAGDERGFSGARASRWAVTVAMLHGEEGVRRVRGRRRGRSKAQQTGDVGRWQQRRKPPDAERAAPVKACGETEAAKQEWLCSLDRRDSLGRW